MNVQSVQWKTWTQWWIDMPVSSAIIQWITQPWNQWVIYDSVAVKLTDWVTDWLWVTDWRNHWLTELAAELWWQRLWCCIYDDQVTISPVLSDDGFDTYLHRSGRAGSDDVTSWLHSSSKSHHINLLSQKLQ